MKQKSGQITVFLSLILMCSCSLVCALLESARTAGARCYLQMAVGSSLDSVLAGYHRELWDDYRLMLLEAEQEEDISREFCDYLNSYAEVDNWYSMNGVQSELLNQKRITDDGGKYFQEEILDYMKYGIFSQIEVSPEAAEGLAGQIKEAKAADFISKSYNSHTNKALKLEKALQSIGNSLKTQNDLCAAGRQALGECDGSGFLSQADKLNKELKKIPGLVNQYEKQADILARDVEKSRMDAVWQSGDLSQGTSDALEEELQSYETYILADGERRREVQGLIEAAEKNSELVESVRKEAEDVIRYIDDWEPEDEGDELEEKELWSPVATHFGNYEQHTLPCAAGVKDEQKKAWLEYITSMADSGLLGLVMPEEKKISSGVWDMADWPSGQLDAGVETDGGNLLYRAITDQYCTMVFTDVLSDEDKTSLYETEYILAGRGSDRENLSEVVKEILAVRTGLNLVHILSDTQKREEARNLAAVIVGVTGLAPLTAVMAVFIMGVWALGEAIMDLRALLQGGKIPILKKADDWQLDLEGLLSLGERGRLEQENLPQKGFSYQGYLKLLLLIECSGTKYYRMMDIIQANLTRKEAAFRMKNCVWMVDIKGTACGKHLFFSIGLVDNLFGGDSQYQMEAKACKTY